MSNMIDELFMGYDIRHIHAQLQHYNGKTFITNFKIDQEELFRRTIDEYGDSNFVIKDDAYDCAGRKVDICKSLHYVGNKTNYLGGGFWDVFDNLKTEYDNKEVIEWANSENI